MNNVVLQVIPVLRMMLGAKDASGGLKTLTVSEKTAPRPVNSSDCLYIESPDPNAVGRKLDEFRTEHNAEPHLIYIEGIGLITVSDAASGGRARGKIIIVTGAAQGFGEGIAECLVREGANVVVADLNEAAGRATAERLDALGAEGSGTGSEGGRAVFVKTNVAEPASLDNLVYETVCRFGGLDVFVSNAGVLRAGGIEDMTPENFDFVTKINYNAYFYCVKAAVPVMKLQNRYAPGNFCDIIQVNSKSGLRGSKANFAYAGGKFGGVGLTQSFALELAPFRIKVNSICPGNFYEGPLWSDPGNGLFIQYLNAGKVPGAKTVEDVRKYYMAQVPMGKGTGPGDVTKAILYAMEQTCETGQAIPVTGGQIMLS